MIDIDQDDNTLQHLALTTMAQAINAVGPKAYPGDPAKMIQMFAIEPRQGDTTIKVKVSITPNPEPEFDFLSSQRTELFVWATEMRINDRNAFEIAQPEGPFGINRPTEVMDQAKWVFEHSAGAPALESQF